MISRTGVSSLYFNDLYPVILSGGVSCHQAMTSFDVDDVDDVDKVDESETNIICCYSADCDLHICIDMEYPWFKYADMRSTVIQATIYLYELGLPDVLDIYVEVIEWFLPPCFPSTEILKIVENTLSSLQRIERNQHREVLQHLMRQMKQINNKTYRIAILSDFKKK